MEKCVFKVPKHTQSRFAKVVIDNDQGSFHLERNDIPAVCLEGPEAALSKAWPLNDAKALQGSETEARELLEGTK